VPPYFRGTNSHTVKGDASIHRAGRGGAGADGSARILIRERGRGEIYTVVLPEPGPDEVLVRTLRSGDRMRRRRRGAEGLG
jgi:hypothetical protein